MRPKILNNQFVYRINKYHRVNIMAYIGREKNVTIPSKIEGLPVANIDAEAFANCKLSSVTIPNSIEFISGWAFYNNNLTNIVIPHSVRHISIETFKNNKLTKVVLPEHISINHNPFDQDVTIKRMEN